MTTILAAFLVRVPVAWYMARTTGRLFHIGLSVPCSTVAEIAACFLFYAYIQRKRQRKGDPLPVVDGDKAA